MLTVKLSNIIVGMNEWGDNKTMWQQTNAINGRLDIQQLFESVKVSVIQNLLLLSISQAMKC